ncbi:MAG: hypothetical protein IJQ33_01490 [Clostridia bacterium]|nr:hypothetical protein [Clostridia bacterium]
MRLDDYLKEAKKQSIENPVTEDSLRCKIDDLVQKHLRGIAKGMHKTVCKAIAEQVLEGKSKAEGIIQLNRIDIFFSPNDVQGFPEKMVNSVASELGFKRTSYSDSCFVSYEQILYNAEIIHTRPSVLFGLWSYDKHTGESKIYSQRYWKIFLNELDHLLSADGIAYSIYVIDTNSAGTQLPIPAEQKHSLNQSFEIQQYDYRNSSIWTILEYHVENL